MTKVLNQCPCCRNDIKKGLPCSFCGHLVTRDRSDIHYDQLVDRNPDTTILQKKILERVEFLSGYINAVDSVMELGCAEGALLKELKKYYPAVSLVGIEPSLDSAKAGINEGIAKIFPSLESVPGNGKFDLFLCFHVLEHMVDVSGILERIKNFLKDNALVVLEVPNFSGHPLVECDNNVEHIHQFTCLSLLFLLERSGYQTLSLKTNVFESKAYPDSIRVIAKVKVKRDVLEDDFVSQICSTIKGDFYCYGGGGDFKKFILPLKGKLKFCGILVSNPTNTEGFVRYDAKYHSSHRILISTLRYEKEILQYLLKTGHDPDLIYLLSDFIG